MSTPTQVRLPWRATVRTIVQVAIPTIIALGVVVPQIVEIILEETGTAMPDGLRAVLLGISAAVVAVAAIVTRVMAIPKVEEFLSRSMRWLAADPAPRFGRPPDEHGAISTRFAGVYLIAVAAVLAAIAIVELLP